MGKWLKLSGLRSSSGQWHQATYLFLLGPLASFLEHNLDGTEVKNDDPGALLKLVGITDKGVLDEARCRDKLPN